MNEEVDDNLENNDNKIDTKFTPSNNHIIGYMNNSNLNNLS